MNTHIMMLKADTPPDSSNPMAAFSTGFSGVIFFWVLGLCIGQIVKMLRRA